MDIKNTSSYIIGEIYTFGKLYGPDTLKKWIEDLSKANILIASWDTRHPDFPNVLCLLGYVLARCKNLRRLYLNCGAEVAKLDDNGAGITEGSPNSLEYILAHENIDEYHYRGNYAVEGMIQLKRKRNYDWEEERAQHEKSIEGSILRQFGVKYQMKRRTHVEVRPVTEKPTNFSPFVPATNYPKEPDFPKRSKVAATMYPGL